MRSVPSWIACGLAAARAVRLPESCAILLVADLLHPIDRFAVEGFLNGHVRHRGRGGCPVPMLLAGRKPHDVPWPDFLDGPALALGAAQARRHDQRLTERMRVPGGSRARLARDARAAR